MRLKRIKLNNFRHHISTEIFFKEGLTVFVGPNGSGKSTIIEAICFGLFGSVALRTRVKDVIPYWRQDEDFLVELEVISDQKLLRLVRTSNTATLEIDGKQTAKGSSEVNDLVAKIIRIDYDKFVSTFLSEQKRLEFLSKFKGRTERENFFLEVLGYNLVDSFLESIREEKKIVKAKLESNQKEDLERLEFQKTTLINQKSKLASKLEELRGKLEEKKELLGKHQVKLSQLAEKRDCYLGLKEKLVDIESQLLKLKKELSASSVGSVDEELKMFKAKHQMLSDEIEKLRANLEQKDWEFQQNLARLEARLDNARQEEQALRVFLNLLNSQEARILKCPTCGQDLKDPQQAEFHVRNKLKRLQSEIQLLNEQLRKLSEERQGLQDDRKKIESRLNDKKELEQEIKLKEEFVQKELVRKGEEQVKKRVLEEMELKRANIARQLEELDFNEELYNQLKFQVQAKELELKNISEEASKLSGELERVNGSLDQIKKLIEELKTYQKEVVKVQKHLRDLEVFEKVVANFRAFVSEKIRPHLSFLASKYVSVLTGSRISAINLAKDFSFQVISGSDVINLLSGGEEDIISLSLRLALSELILRKEGFKFELLILDEVFGYLDTERRTETLNLLFNFKSIFSQIILISHIENVQDFADSTVRFKLDPETGMSIVTQV